VSAFGGEGHAVGTQDPLLGQRDCKGHLGAIPERWRNHLGAGGLSKGETSFCKSGKRRGREGRALAALGASSIPVS